MQALFHNIRKVVSLSSEEGEMVQAGFSKTEYRKGSYFLKESTCCKKVGYIEMGAVIYTQLVDGEEKVCDFLFDDQWCTQIKSLTTGAPSEMSIQAIEDSTVWEISIDKLQDLSVKVPKVNEVRLKLSETAFIEIAQRSLDLANLNAEQRYAKLMAQRPDILQRVPLSYIASYLGVTQRHLSRLRAIR